MSKKIKVIKFPVGSDPMVVEIDDSLEAMQAVVGGYLEVVVVDGLDLWCNEEGLIDDMPFNRLMGGHAIHGDFFLARHDDEGDSTSVTAADIAKFVNRKTGAHPAR